MCIFKANVNTRLVKNPPAAPPPDYVIRLCSRVHPRVNYLIMYH